MIQHEFEELLEQFSQDELNEKSTVKGQFTSYITRRMEWHCDFLGSGPATSDRY